MPYLELAACAEYTLYPEATPFFIVLYSAVCRVDCERTDGREMLRRTRLGLGAGVAILLVTLAGLDCCSAAGEGEGMREL